MVDVGCTVAIGTGGDCGWTWMFLSCNAESLVFHTVDGCPVMSEEAADPHNCGGDPIVLNKDLWTALSNSIE